MADGPTPRRTNRNTELGDRACFCASCGWARRYFPGVVEAPTRCPSCDDVVVSACAQCGESVLSVMAVECDVCAAPLRAPRVGDLRIRRVRRLPVTPSPAPPDSH